MDKGKTQTLNKRHGGLPRCKPLLKIFTGGVHSPGLQTLQGSYPRRFASAKAISRFSPLTVRHFSLWYFMPVGAIHTVCTGSAAIRLSSVSGEAPISGSNKTAFTNHFFMLRFLCVYTHTHW
jgi:hypothetical protein